MDVTPLIAKGKKIIESYGDMSFSIDRKKFLHNVIVFPDSIVSWQASFDTLNIDDFAPIFENSNEPNLLLIGCGETHQPLSSTLRTQLRERGIVTEIMTTGAACRTYNVLLSEERNLAAALFAVE